MRRSQPCETEQEELQGEASVCEKPQRSESRTRAAEGPELWQEPARGGEVGGAESQVSRIQGRCEQSPGALPI